MIIGIMQPYYLPYIGYFQLMKAVNTFVYYDDVTYIKQGWINRNNIILKNGPHRFTLELKGASSFKKINEIEVGGNRDKLYKTFLQAYSKAPYYRDADQLLWDIFHSEEKNLFQYILQSHKLIFDYLGINIEVKISSNIKKDESLSGKARVIDICRRLEGNTYINAYGGKSLYSKDEFMDEGIRLLFLKPYDELPKTSIIDVIMNHSKKEVVEMLTKKYKYE